MALFSQGPSVKDGPGQEATGTEPAERAGRDGSRRRRRRRRITEDAWQAKA